MNIQIYLEDTYNLIKEEPVILILGGLVVQLAAILTMGILAGPFLGGYLLLIIYYLRENRKPKFNDIFSGLQQFANLLPYFLVLLTIFIGFMLLVLPGLVFATWWLYVLPLMVDKKISFSEAMKLSTNKVNETGFLMHLIFLLLITVLPFMLLNFISTMLPFLFVLKILLPPFQAGCLASLYVDQFREIDIETEPEQEIAAPVAETPQAAEAAELEAQEGQETSQAEQSVSSSSASQENNAADSLRDEKPAHGINAEQHQTEEEPNLDPDRNNKDKV